MLQDIFDALKNIVSFIGGIGDFISDFLRDTVYVIGLLAQFSGGLATHFTWLPVGLVAIVSVALGIAIIFRVIGR